MMSSLRKPEIGTNAIMPFASDVTGNTVLRFADFIPQISLSGAMSRKSNKTGGFQSRGSGA